MTVGEVGAVGLIGAGEVFAILAQFRAFDRGQTGKPTVGWRVALLWVVSGVLLVGGYAAGVRAFGNVWPVAAASVASILVVEPIVIGAVTGTAPNRRETCGLLLGAAGLVVTLFG